MVWNADATSLYNAVQKHNEEITAHNAECSVPPPACSDSCVSDLQQYRCAERERNRQETAPCRKTESENDRRNKCCESADISFGKDDCCCEKMESHAQRAHCRCESCRRNAEKGAAPREEGAHKPCSRQFSQSNPISDIFGGLLSDKDSMLLAVVILLLLNENADKKLILALAYVLLF